MNRWGLAVGCSDFNVFRRALIGLFFLVSSTTQTESTTEDRTQITETAFWETQTINSGNSDKLCRGVMVGLKATLRDSGGTAAEIPAGF